MSEARTVWHDLQTRRTAVVSRQWSGVLLAAVLLTAMCGAEVVFLKYVAAPDTMNLLNAMEGTPTLTQD